MIKNSELSQELESFMNKPFEYNDVEKVDMLIEKEIQHKKDQLMEMKVRKQKMTKELDKFLLEQKRLLDEKLKIIQDKPLSSLTSNSDSATIIDDVEKLNSNSEVTTSANLAELTQQEEIPSQQMEETELTHEVKVEGSSQQDDQQRESVGSGAITVSEEDDESDNESANTA